MHRKGMSKVVYLVTELGLIQNRWYLLDISKTLDEKKGTQGVGVSGGNPPVVHK